MSYGVFVRQQTKPIVTIEAGVRVVSQELTGKWEVVDYAYEEAYSVLEFDTKAEAIIGARHYYANELMRGYHTS